MRVLCPIASSIFFNVASFIPHLQQNIHRKLNSAWDFDQWDTWEVEPLIPPMRLLSFHKLLEFNLVPNVLLVCLVQYTQPSPGQCCPVRDKTHPIVLRAAQVSAKYKASIMVVFIVLDFP